MSGIPKLLLNGVTFEVSHFPTFDILYFGVKVMKN